MRDLGEGAVLLQIYLADDQANLLLTTPGVQIARQSKVKLQELNRQIAAFRRLLRDPKSDPMPEAQALYQLLLAPVARDLEQAGAKTVMLSLDGALRYVPFGALHDGQRHVLRRRNLPIYTSVVRNRLRDEVLPKWQAAGLGVTRKLGEFDALPGVHQEMRSIIRSGNARAQTKIALDEASHHTALSPGCQAPCRRNVLVPPDLCLPQRPKRITRSTTKGGMARCWQRLAA